jgi:ABC-2 type transport system ATP-binding protein
MEITPLLRVDGLGFHFDGRTMFDRFSVVLGSGVTWLRGPNGAGKTTLLKLLGGALLPQAGTIRITEIDSLAAPQAYRLQCFYCGGETPQLPWLTVREFLDLYAALYPALEAAALNLHLDAFGISAVLDQATTTLSLGQHKKLQLALALALPVRLLLIDEPFNGLDTAAAEYLRARLSDPMLLGRTCIVLVSHVEPMVPLAGIIDL